MSKTDRQKTTNKYKISKNRKRSDPRASLKFIKDNS